MPNRARYKIKLKIEFLRKMADDGHVYFPNNISRGDALEWFLPEDQDLAEEIIDELIADAGAPVDSHQEEGSEVLWLTGFQETRSYVRDLRRSN